MDFFFEFLNPFLNKEKNPLEKHIGNGLEIYDPYHGVIYKNGTSDIHPVELGYFRLNKFIRDDTEILCFVVKEKIDDWTFILPTNNDLKEFKIIEMKFHNNISKHNSDIVKREFKEFMEYEGINIHYI